MTYVACCVVRIFGHPYAVRNTHHDTASNMDLKRLHRWTGIVTVIVFLMTGLYMRWQFPDLYAGNETIRHLSELMLAKRSHRTTQSHPMTTVVTTVDQRML